MTAANSALRQWVRGAVEEAAGIALPVTDPLPDELVWAAEAEGIPKPILLAWIYGEHPDQNWSAPALVRWFREEIR